MRIKADDRPPIKKYLRAAAEAVSDAQYRDARI